MQQPASESPDSVTLVSLWDMTEGQIGEICSYSSELTGNSRGRLQQIGFLPGSEVSCLLTTKLGAPRLYKVHNTVFSLDNTVAQYVQVALRDQ